MEVQPWSAFVEILYFDQLTETTYSLGGTAYDENQEAELLRFWNALPSCAQDRDPGLYARLSEFDAPASTTRHISASTFERVTGMSLQASVLRARAKHLTRCAIRKAKLGLANGSL